MALWRSTIHGTFCGQTIDVIHGWFTGPLDDGEVEDLASRIEDVWQAQVMPALSTGYGTTSVKVVGVDEPTRFAEVGSEAFGENANTRLPAYVNANVQLITPLRGRSYRGRFGIPGLCEDMNDTVNGNLLNDGVRDNLQDRVGAFKFGVASGTVSAALVVISTISGGEPRPEPIFTGVTSLVVKTALGSRVSRKG